jgi:hypothetical protein
MPDLHERFGSVRRFPPPDLWPEIERRDPRARLDAPWRRLGIAAVALALAAAGATVATRAFLDRAGNEAPQPVPRGDVVGTVPLEGARGVALGAGSLWVAVWPEESGPSLLRMDPQNGEVIAEIPLEALTSWELNGQGVSVTDEAVWVVGGHRRVVLQRVDPASNRLAETIDLGPGHAADVAADETAVWVTILRGDDFASPEVLRVDAATGEVIATIRLAEEWARDVLISDGYVFIHQQDVRGSGGFRESSLVRINPGTNQVIDELPGGRWTIEAVVVWESDVWTTQGYGIRHIDPTTNSYVGEPVRLERGGPLFASGGGGLWFSGPGRVRGSVEVSRFSPSTGEVDVVVRLPRDANPVDMAVTDDDIWIVDYREFLTQIDLRFPGEERSTKESTNDDGRTKDPASSARTLSAGGIQASIPDGWEGKVYQIRGYTRPVVRIATFPLPDEDDVEASKARSDMREDDVLIDLTEYSAVCPCPGFVQIDLPVSLDAEAFEAPFDVWHDIPPQSAAVPTYHAFARRTFAVDDRFFDLWVEFGRTPAPDETVSAVNALLKSLTISTYEPPQQPDGLCNEWSLQKDPDCPQTIWIKSVLSEAGFAVVDSAEESTLVGRGEGAKFFIWTREPTAPLEESGLRYQSTIEGVDVYGGTHLVWRAQGLNVWIAPGPEGGDEIPDEAGLSSLVRASLGTPYPPEA